MISRGTGYIKGADGRAGTKLGAHINYISHRAGEDKETGGREIFGKDADQVDRHEAKEDIEAHGDAHVAYHKMVLSPSDEEREGIGDDLDAWKTWTREVMSDLEDMKGQELTWYATFHDNTDNPHVHVVMAGSGTDLESGEDRTVKMFREDYRALDEFGQDHGHFEHNDMVNEIAKGEETREREQGYGSQGTMEGNREREEHDPGGHKHEHEYER